jgi:hypothetical protein
MNASAFSCGVRGMVEHPLVGSALPEVTDLQVERASTAGS